MAVRKLIRKPSVLDNRDAAEGRARGRAIRAGKYSKRIHDTIDK